MSFAHGQSSAAARQQAYNPLMQPQGAAVLSDAVTHSAGAYSSPQSSGSVPQQQNSSFQNSQNFQCSEQRRFSFCPVENPFLTLFPHQNVQQPQSYQPVQQPPAQTFPQPPRLLRIPTRFNQNAHDALMEDGRPLIRALFWEEFYSGNAELRDGFYHCRDWSAHRELAWHLKTPVDYFQYAAPALVTEYLKKGALKQKQLRSVRYCEILNVTLEGATAGYLKVQLDQALCDMAWAAAPWVCVLAQLHNPGGPFKVQKSQFQLHGTCVGDSCFDFLLIRLERLPDRALWGAQLDCAASVQQYRELLSFLPVGSQDCQIEVFQVFMGAVLQLEMTQYNLALRHYIEAIKKVSDGAAHVLNLQLLLGAFQDADEGPDGQDVTSSQEKPERPERLECQGQNSQPSSPQSPQQPKSEVKRPQKHQKALQQQLTRASALLCDEQQVAEALGTLQSMIEIMQQQNRLAAAPASAINAQLVLARHVLTSSTALVQCAERANAALTACLTLLALVRAYDGRGRVLCCAASREQADQLAASAAVFGLSHRAVYCCDQCAGAGETQKASISLQNIVRGKVKDRKYVGTQLTAAQNDRLERIMADNRFDVLAAQPEYQALEQHELESCGLLITTVSSLGSARFQKVSFAASFVFGADRLLEPECMLPISYAPSHVVLMVAGEQTTPKLLEQRLSYINFDQSLFRRLSDMGLPVFQAKSELQPSKKYAQALAAPGAGQNRGEYPQQLLASEEKPAAERPGSCQISQPVQQQPRQPELKAQIPPPQAAPPESYLQPVPAVQQKMSFFWHVQTSEAAPRGGPRQLNIAEGQAVKSAVEALTGQFGFACNRIAVLTLYQQQATLLQQFLKQFPGVTIATHGQFRGDAADAIIVSCVHSNEPFQRDFPNLMPLLQREIQCATRWFLLVGDAVHWSSADEEWVGFIFGCQQLNKLFSGSSFTELRPFSVRQSVNEPPAKTTIQPGAQGQSPVSVTLKRSARSKSTSRSCPERSASRQPCRQFVNCLLHEESGSAQARLNWGVSPQFLQKVSEKLDSAPERHFCAVCGKLVQPGSDAALLLCGHIAHRQCYGVMTQRGVSCLQCRGAIQ